MKKFLSYLALIVIPLAAVYAGTHVGPVGTGGYQIGKTSSELFALWGHATAAQPAATMPTRAALQSFGGLAADGTTTATAVAGATTLNTTLGTVTTEGLTTAAAATYTLTLTNSTVGSASIVVASVDQNGSTGLPVITSVTPGSGSVVIKVTNLHASAAFNAALKISFQVVK